MDEKKLDEWLEILKRDFETLTQAIEACNMGLISPIEVTSRYLAEVSMTANIIVRSIYR